MDIKKLEFLLRISKNNRGKLKNLNKGIYNTLVTAHKTLNELETKGLIKCHMEGRIMVKQITKKGRLVCKKLIEINNILENGD